MCPLRQDGVFGLDALVRYGISEPDLGDAYRKAGVAFKGLLEQNFMVLHEKDKSAKKEKCFRRQVAPTWGHQKSAPRKKKSWSQSL
jgi:hypothetical protein